MTSPPRAVALIAAYNEADIVGQVLAHLILRRGIRSDPANLGSSAEQSRLVG
jgi:hypothetical protein